MPARPDAALMRSWTQFEAWLSMQKSTPEGLRPAAPEERRCTVVPIKGANSIMVESLLAMWSHREPEEAYNLLKDDDVTVTNQSDKEMQLPKILKLNEEVSQSMASTRQRRPTLERATAFENDDEDEDEDEEAKEADDNAHEAPNRKISRRLVFGSARASTLLLGGASTASHAGKQPTHSPWWRPRLSRRVSIQPDGETTAQVLGGQTGAVELQRWANQV